jgi:hypothetical protein
MKANPIICIVLCSVASIAMIGSPSARASINSYNWISAVARNDYDSFFGGYVTGYTENTTASLVVSVSNDFSGYQANVSAVKVGFDWGTNFSSSECSIDNPFAIPGYQSHVFTIDFTVPSAVFASNLVTHGYTIYVERVNSTTGNKGVIGTWTQSGSGFVVFSVDQAAAREYKRELEAYPTSNIYGIPFLTANARLLYEQSSVAKTLAGEAYGRGDFGSAKTYYSSSLSYIEQAWSNETDKWSTFENAIANLLNGGGNLLSMQGYAWVIFAIGFFIISIGVLVRLTRRRAPALPKPP